MLTWRIKQQKYGGPTHLLMSGAMPVGEVSYNGLRSRNDDEGNTYVWSLYLPGKKREGKAATREVAMQEAWDAFADWVRVAQLQVGL